MQATLIVLIVVPVLVNLVSSFLWSRYLANWLAGFDSARAASRIKKLEDRLGLVEFYAEHSDSFSRYMLRKLLLFCPHILACLWASGAFITTWISYEAQRIESWTLIPSAALVIAPFTMAYWYVMPPVILVNDVMEVDEYRSRVEKQIAGLRQRQDTRAPS
jgi:hypothetical protein